LTINDLFQTASLTPLGPVRWRERISESSPGVYVVARVGEPTVGCEECPLPLIDPLPPNLHLDSEYELRRWLPNEPVLYIGQTGRTIQERITEFYDHECGNRRPHAGGQIIKLLRCDLWIYWSPATYPKDAERAMILAFKEQVGQKPFANWDRKLRPSRVHTAML
jgi:hypothetical protein